MPYIPEVRRWQLLITREAVPETAGELNFMLSVVAKAYMHRAKDEGTFGYQTLNDIVGALEGAKLEFVRRVVNPYEDAKIVENGDIYEGTDAHAPEAAISQVPAGSLGSHRPVRRRPTGGGCGTSCHLPLG